MHNNIEANKVNYKSILELIKAKDKKAYEVLYVQFADKFFGYAVAKWCFTEDEAMHVVYKTLETLVLKLSNYKIESQSHFDNLVYKIFTNFLRQEFRKNRNQQHEVSFSELLKGDSDSSLDEIDASRVESLFSHESLKEYYQSDSSENPKLSLLKKALEELESFDKDILLLRAQNFSYGEIATMLNIENNQLKVKHHRAKSRLIKILQQKQFSA
jgi:RNA polymerase sigma factor (sigma-70 family)